MASASAGIGSALPSQVGNSGLFLTTDGTVATWASTGGGTSVTSLTGDVTGTGPGATATTITNAVKSVAAVGSSPSANGASIATTVLTLQPADRTHPGVASTATQIFGGLKGFDAGAFVPAASDHTTPIILLGDVSDVAFGLWAYPSAASPSSSNFLCVSDISGNAFLRAAAGHTNLMVGSTVSLAISTTSADMTGLGAGGSIKLKSPDGTTYTITIANGGTLVIT